MTTYTNNPRFEWGAVVAGAILALAISIVLFQFGTVIGLSATSPLRGEANLAAWGVIATGIYLLWVQILSSLAGGYVAGRLRRPHSDFPAHDAEMKDGLAGMLTWALATVLIFIGVSIFAAFSAYMATLTTQLDVIDTINNNEKNKSIIFAFGAGSTAIISAVAAWWAGTVGGDHRDKQTDLSDLLSFRKK